jgi:hypothetical protein
VSRKGKVTVVVPAVEIVAGAMNFVGCYFVLLKDLPTSVSSSRLGILRSVWTMDGKIINHKGH